MPVNAAIEAPVAGTAEHGIAHRNRRQIKMTSGAKTIAFVAVV